MEESHPIALPVVLGPTGSGKSELGIRIAEELNGEIVNCDSVQIYRRFQIGTAKVPESERRGIPHHLIDLVEPGELFTAGDYARAGRTVLTEISRRGRIPVVVGGTGFYLRALLEGLSPGPPRQDALRARLLGREQKRHGSLHRILTRLDPAAAERIHRNDLNKTLRALEVRLLAGRPITRLFAEGRSPLQGFRPIKIGLSPERDLLYRKLDLRAAAMFQRGLMAEVRDLLASGVPAHAKPFESLGYQQALQAARGVITEEQAIESTQRETRRYAKRQVTWFRKEQDVHWLAGFGDEPQVVEQALTYIKNAIKKF
ncbi:MAG TPA: tRNA (adenosine(37)-N6)-dimethylallyltransferase MiaA [Bryobacteraceae bacterium]|nr:tRNA (adenosine(37)-N6)-dimethylallyltransferase MiaA [Bryobacteraceae bacterium]